MKCPNCDAELEPAHRHGVETESCPACHGLWLTRQELGELEDKAFDLGEGEKGTLAFRSTSATRKCPQCAQAMQTFDYRLYDLQLEFCEAGHGFWLDADEDRKVMDLMKEEEARLKRTSHAQTEWSSLMRHLRSGSLLEKVRDFFR